MTHPRKYCDITGFEAKYTDPKTKLRYYNSKVFAMIRNLNDNSIEEYLSLRNASNKIM